MMFYEIIININGHQAIYTKNTDGEIQIPDPMVDDFGLVGINRFNSS